MEGGASVATTELDIGVGATCSVCNLNNTLLAVCADSGEVATYTAGDDERQWTPSPRWNVGQGTPLQAAWAHPEFGALLAILVDTGVVTLWAEQYSANDGTGMALQSMLLSPHACVMAFAPKHQGLQLAVGSADGRVRVYQAAIGLKGVKWVPQSDFEASSAPCTALCWRSSSPALPPLLLVASEQGGQVFCYNGRLMAWQPAAMLGDGPVADAAWASPAGGQAGELVATASGSTVRIWSLQGRPDQLQVDEVAALTHCAKVRQVSWNSLGTWLAAVMEDSCVCLWRPNLAGEWLLQSKILPADPENEYVMVD